MGRAARANARRGIPITLYKHSEVQWVKLMVEHGRVRLRPFSYYWASHAPTRDQMEGRTEHRLEPVTTMRVHTDDLEPILAPNIGIRGVRPGAGAFFEVHAGSASRSGTQVPTQYIFCVSETHDELDVGPDRYEIRDPIAFGSLLARRLVDQAVPLVSWALGKVAYDNIRLDIVSDASGLGPIKYPHVLATAFDLDGKRMWDKRFHLLYFTKDEKDRGQREWHGFGCACVSSPLLAAQTQR